MDAAQERSAPIANAVCLATQPGQVDVLLDNHVACTFENSSLKLVRS